MIATLTRDDIQRFNYKYGATYKDQSILAVDKVRYVGDPVAAVLADEPATAEQALELIEFEYEELPIVSNIEDALRKTCVCVAVSSPRNAARRSTISATGKAPSGSSKAQSDFPSNSSSAEHPQRRTNSRLT